MPGTGKHVLLKWIQDDQYGIMPFSYVQKTDVYPGVVCDVNWKKEKQYQALILKILLLFRFKREECPRYPGMDGGNCIANIIQNLA